MESLREYAVMKLSTHIWRISEVSQVWNSWANLVASVFEQFWSVFQICKSFHSHACFNAFCLFPFFLLGVYQKLVYKFIFFVRICYDGWIAYSTQPPLFEIGASATSDSLFAFGAKLTSLFLGRFSSILSNQITVGKSLSWTCPGMPQNT